MAIDNDVAMFQENAGDVYNAVEYRRMFDRLLTGFDVRAWGGSASSATGNGGVSRHYGAATTGDLAVIQRAAGANMSVDVLLGGCMVGGTENAHQGNYWVYSDATVNVPIAASHASLDRYDIVGVQVEDTAYGGGVDVASITVIEGTPAGTPSEPALPDNFLPLARVEVDAAVTSIVTAKITDRRRMIAALGGVVVCTSATLPSNPWEGQVVFQTDTDDLWFYDGSAWKAVGDQGLPPGMVVDSVLSSAPTNWVLLYGQTIANAQTLYPTLWTGLSSVWKSGSSLVCPDCRGRGRAGLDNMGGSDAGRLDWGNTMGTAGGEQNHTLSANEMPWHQHGYKTTDGAGTVTTAYTGGSNAFTATGDWDQSTGAAGASWAHNNMQPTILLNAMMKLK